jgi:hypothetical protein
VEVAAHLCPALLGLEEVVEVEAELLRQLLRRQVAAVDELTTALVDLAFGEGARTGPAAATDAPGCLVDGGDDACLPEAMRSGETCEPGADDGDPCGCGGARGDCEPPHRSEADPGDPGHLDEIEPGQRRLGPPSLSRSLRRDLRNCLFESLHCGCASHAFPLMLGRVPLHVVLRSSGYVQYRLVRRRSTR